MLQRQSDRPSTSDGVMACSHRRRGRDKTVLSCRQLCSHRRQDSFVSSRPSFQFALSGGATVFAARGTRLFCRPCQSDQFCNQGIFQDFGRRDVNHFWGSLLFPSLLFPPLRSPLPSHLSILQDFPSLP